MRTPQAPQPQPNGIHRAATPATAPTPPVEKPVTPSPAPAAAAPTPPPAAAAPAAAPSPSPAPAPAQPPPPKTWANLAAANSKKWGSAVAQDSRGTTEVAPATPSTPQAPAAPTGGPGAGAQRGPAGQQGQHLNLVAALNVTTPQCFVKGVIEPISPTLLTNHLNTHFGPLKDLEIVRSKACAFFEFLNLDAARRAIVASLPSSQGGEGGVWIDCGAEGNLRISIETRKERGDRPVSRPRGGGPMGEGRGGEGRGRGEGFRGGRGRGAGRGGPGAK